MAFRATIWSGAFGRCFASCGAIALIAAGTAWGDGKTDATVSAASTQPRIDPPPRANAGDDQDAKVGDQITLDGSGSAPHTGVSYRWIPAGGPPIRLKLDNQCVYTWIPEAPGTYRFALVIAGGGGISEPDYVEVTVSDNPKVTLSDPATVVTTREALQTLAVSEELGGALAEIYGRIAARMELYESYNMLLHELSRSLEPLIPADPSVRASWNARLFVPLSGLLVNRLRAQSLDLMQAESLASPLNRTQRQALALFFGEVAEGCRTVQDDRR